MLHQENKKVANYFGYVKIKQNTKTKKKLIKNQKKKKKETLLIPSTTTPGHRTGSNGKSTFHKSSEL